MRLKASWAINSEPIRARGIFVKYLIGQFSVYRGIFVRVTLYFSEPLDEYNTRDEYKYFLFKYNYGKEKTGH